MMWLQSIKDALFDERCRRGLPCDKVMVNKSDLFRLLETFESLDSELRLLKSNEYKDVNTSQLLNLHIRKMWKSDSQSADEIMLVFANVIKELLAEKERRAPRLSR
tara:strand:- start:8688 stop:9005 length:318 start_codon:yes stop_codon:yes gene_type:complete